MNWILKYLPTNPTTITGRMLGIATIAAMLAVVDSSLVPLLSLLIWIVLVAFVCGLLFRPKLTFHMQESPLLINGQDATIEIRVENIGRYPAYDLQLSFPYSDQGLQIEDHPKAIGELAAQGQAILIFQIKPRARGDHLLPRILVASLFPFGMFKFVSKYSIETRVLVAPYFGTEAQSVEMNQSGDSHQGSLNSCRHRELEYIGSREYREGLTVRRWDFAAWARLGIPSIREFSESQEAQVLIAVDTLKSRDRIDGDLEKLLSKAATAAVALNENGLRIVLVIIGEQVEVIDGYGNRDQGDMILRGLAKVAGTHVQSDWAETWSKIRDMLTQDAELICFLRSDHSGVDPSPPDDFQLTGFTVDWTPGQLMQNTSKAVSRSPAYPIESRSEQ